MRATTARADDGPPSATPAATSAGEPTPTPTEVHVTAPPRPIGATTIRAEDARHVPGTFGDPARVVEALPGVVPTTSGLQAFFVRGAPPTSTGYYIDGIPVPALYHLGFGPSVVHPALVDRVEFYPGGAPARFGRFVGATLATTLAPPVDRPRAEANVRLFDAGGVAESPFADGRGNAAVGARYGYPGLVIPLFAPDVGLTYWDYQGRASYRLSRADVVSALAFGSYDELTQRDEGASGASVLRRLAADEFHRVDLRWDHRLASGSGAVRAGVTIGRDVVGDEIAGAIDDTARLRVDLDDRLSPTWRIDAGADAQVDRLRPGNPPPSAPASAPPLQTIVAGRDGLVVGAYADVAWRPAPRVEVVPGLRVDVYGSTVRPGAGSAAGVTRVEPAVEPRLAARVMLGRGVAVTSTFGVDHEQPGLYAQYPDVTPFLQPGVQEGLSSSVQLSEGIEVPLPGKLLVGATGFLHEYSGLPDSTSPCRFDPSSGACVTQNVNGRAYGLELLARRPLTERLTIWVSYTLSRATREARIFPRLFPTLVIPSEYDRTHVVTAMASYKFGAGWLAGARVFAYSGRPYTRTSSGVPLTPYDDVRLPGFFRVDLRLEKSWVVGAHGRLALVFEGLNVTGNKEAVSASCGVLAPGSACPVDQVGPIVIPSVGLEGALE